MSDHESDQELEPEGREYQFTLRQLCVITVLLAASMSLSQLLRSPIPAFFGLNFVLVMAFVYLLQLFERRIRGQGRFVEVVSGLLIMGLLLVGELLIGFALLPLMRR
jgi:hypothetical protein